MIISTWKHFISAHKHKHTWTHLHELSNLAIYRATVFNLNKKPVKFNMWTSHMLSLHHHWIDFIYYAVVEWKSGHVIAPLKIDASNRVVVLFACRFKFRKSSYKNNLNSNRKCVFTAQRSALICILIMRTGRVQWFRNDWKTTFASMARHFS